MIELKIEHNVGQLDADRIRAFQQKIKSPWASNLPITVFTYLLDEGYKQLSNVNEELPSKGNDMELFHFNFNSSLECANKHFLLNLNNKNMF